MNKTTEIVIDHTIVAGEQPEAQAALSLAITPFYGDENSVISVRIQRTVRIDQTLTVDWDVINATVLPGYESGTETFNPGDVSKNFGIFTGEVSTIEVGTFQLSNPQYVSGPVSTPILGSPSSTPFTIYDTDASVKRWNPHHGYKIQGDATNIDQTGYWNGVAIGLGASSPVNDSANLKGVLFGVAWGVIEPTLGSRDWSELDSAMSTAEANGLFVNLQITFKNFRENSTLIGPTDLDADRLENVNANGTPVNTMATFREHVMTRYIAICIEILNRYGTNTSFEILSSAELLMSFGTGTAPSDYSTDALATQNKRMHTEVGAVTTPVNFMPNINQLSGEMTDLMESLYINRIGHGSPDLRETPGHTMFKGETSVDGQVPVRDYRGEIGKQSIVSFQDWAFGAFTSVADILSITIPDYGLTHLYWANQEAGTFTWAELISSLNANPNTLVTACPNRWPGCSAGI